MRLLCRFLLAVLMLAFSGCKREHDKDSGELGDLGAMRATTNGSHASSLTNAVDPEAAVKLAEAEARKHGRSIMRVGSCRQEGTNWVVRLEFEPYDQLGNHAWVIISTEGVVEKYVRGR